MEYSNGQTITMKRVLLIRAAFYLGEKIGNIKNTFKSV